MSWIMNSIEDISSRAGTIEFKSEKQFVFYFCMVWYEPRTHPANKPPTRTINTYIISGRIGPNCDAVQICMHSSVRARYQRMKHCGPRYNWARVWAALCKKENDPDGLFHGSLKRLTNGKCIPTNWLFWALLLLARESGLLLTMQN